MDAKITETKLRKYRDNMRISACAMLIFGVWNILKCVLYLVMGDKYFDKMIGTYSSFEGVRTLVIVFCFIVLVIDLLLKLGVGSAALKESRGRKRGYGYIVYGTILFIGYVIMDIYALDMLWNVDDVEMLIDQIIALVVDITSIYALGDLLYCSIRFKALTKKLERGDVNAG